MKRKVIVDMLKALGAKVPGSQPRSNWIVSDCPLGPWRHEGGKSSAEVFGVKIESGDPFCNCFSCGFHGSAMDLVLTMQKHHSDSPNDPVPDFKSAINFIVEAEDEFDLNLDTPNIEELMEQKANAVTIFDDWWVSTFPKATDVPKALKYMTEDRGIDPEVVEYLDIRWDPHEGRVIFPIRNDVEKVVGFHGRALAEDQEPRYRMYTYKGRNNPQFWLGENWVDFSMPILVVEGPFDLAACLPVYGNTVCPLFANPSFEKLKRMAGAFDWVTFLDRGTGGDKGRARITEAMGKDHIVKHLLPPEHRKDPGACTFDELVGVLAQHLPI